MGPHQNLQFLLSLLGEEDRDKHVDWEFAAFSSELFYSDRYRRMSIPEGTGKGSFALDAMHIAGLGPTGNIRLHEFKAKVLDII